uniref:NADAR domain-containing protein n=1 Tax=Caenorhabditis japonica TaxID=281687 RepID=A0A8R1EFH8_CAEJA
MKISVQINPEIIADKVPKMDRWRQSAMKHKIFHNEYLQQLLLSTGSAILIDSSLGDPLWTCGATEVEIQRLLTKSYVTPEKLISWMIGNGDKGTPKRLKHLYGNKSGLLLMELREKMSTHTKSRIPLVSPINTTPLSAIVTPNVICFTPESVFHPLYPAEIRCSVDGPPLPSPAHYVAT